MPTDPNDPLKYKPVAPWLEKVVQDPAPIVKELVEQKVEQGPLTKEKKDQPVEQKNEEPVADVKEEQKPLEVKEEPKVEEPKVEQAPVETTQLAPGNISTPTE